VTHLVVEVPDEPLVLAEPASDPTQLREAARRIVDALGAARFPAIVVDADVDLRRHDMSIGATQMPGVGLRDVLDPVVQQPTLPVTRTGATQPTVAASDDALPGAPDDPLTHAALWPRIHRFLKSGDVIFGEAGTSHAALSSMKLPAGATYIAQPIWSAIGYTLPRAFRVAGQRQFATSSALHRRRRIPAHCARTFIHPASRTETRDFPAEQCGLHDRALDSGGTLCL
jgi:TPP-dependent 2-oxoacid decarboxylase